jgi:hypothetical protein
MTSGAVAIAAIAAARRRRMQEIVDAFRLADATTTERAKSCAAVGVDSGSSELVDLVRDGVLAKGLGIDTLYVDERAYIAHRSGRNKGRKLAVVSVLLLAIALLGFGYFTVLSGR